MSSTSKQTATTVADVDTARRSVSLSGVVAVILIFAGTAAGGNAPNGKASVPTVVAFYGSHSGAQTASGVLLSLGALLFLIFAATLAARIRRIEGAALGAPTLCLVGAGALVAGLAVFAGLSITISDVAGEVGGPVLQTLNVLANDAAFVFLITIGTSAFLVGAAAAVFTTGLLPRWLGWFAIVIAIVGAIPSHVLGGALDHIGFLAFVGLGVWAVTAGVLLAREPRPFEGDARGLRQAPIGSAG